ncbi:hypothetical protein NEMBOFW57_005569 [Staphylotrichum longicolle]|uniref:Ceramide glucosyltransferase n=1 Tax=Staphylotrichum longicolle TaxID=669026 RepID=A0AAD4EXK5_9PEZI|nr:hypothetical protein NEMBOFW57_005569 [Staphylotrichum longicolle]
MSIAVQGAALVSLVWSCAVFLVQTIGISQLFRHHSAPHPKPVSPTLKNDEVPHITLIRPVKGVEPRLYECLASAFRLAYPKSKLTIYLCVASTDDPAYPILQDVVRNFPGFDAKVMVEQDDPLLHGTGGNVNNLGPNPKIRNMSRAYREAKGDIIWVVDCNVWIGTGSAGRMVDKLCGFQPGGARTIPYKLVHQLPLVHDIDDPEAPEAQGLLSHDNHSQGRHPTGLLSHGGRLEEMFMSTSHAKFYGAINTVCIAPCIVGKSTMFRKSHLDRFTDPSQNPILPASDASRGRGLDFFSSYICEDHLIGDLIWRSSAGPGSRFGNHALVFGEWTVPAATLIEPGVEPSLCALHFSFALTTLPWFRERVGIPQTWGAMALAWLGTVTVWMLVDRVVSNKLRRLQSVEVDEDTPSFARGSGRRGGIEQRPFGEWLAAWVGRELLALPIWTWAVLLGTTVAWRGKRFRVRMDMSVVAIDGETPSSSLLTPGADTSRPNSRSKDRVD